MEEALPANRANMSGATSVIPASARSELKLWISLAGLEPDGSTWYRSGTSDRVTSI